MWHRKYGNWWMIQWCFDWWISFGIHVDFRHRKKGNETSYGPYIDFHLGIIIISLGIRPVFIGDDDYKNRSSIAIGREV